MRQLKLGHSADVETFRRMALNARGRNCDDHTKNYSFLLKKGGPWELFSAYDITFARNPRGEWTSRHLMSVNGKFADISKEDCLALADRFAIGEAPSILKQVREAVEAWPDFAAQAKVTASEIGRIRGHLRSL